MKDRMRRLFWKYQDFMRGRNGFDDLNRALLGFYIALAFLQLFLRGVILSIISLLLVVMIVVRALSKNFGRRQKENIQYQEFSNLMKAKWVNRRDYKVFRCKNCGKLVRVPRGKGKIEASCPKCRQRRICRT